MKRIAVTIAVIVGVLLVAANPASAHTQEEYDAWLTEWSEQVLANGALTVEDIEQLHDFNDRHPCLAEYCAPVTRVSSSTASASVKKFSGTVENWRGLVEAYFPADAVPWAMRVMQCESGGNPNAKNPGSSASGLFQHLARYWDDRSAKAGWGGSNIFDPEANIAVAAWLYTTGGPGHWVCR